MMSVSSSVCRGQVRKVILLEYLRKYVGSSVFVDKKRVFGPVL